MASLLHNKTNSLQQIQMEPSQLESYCLRPSARKVPSVMESSTPKYDSDLLCIHFWSVLAIIIPSPSSNSLWSSGMLFACCLLHATISSAELFLLFACMIVFHLLTSLSKILLLLYPVFLLTFKDFLFSFGWIILVCTLCNLCILFLLYPYGLLILVIDPFCLVFHDDFLKIGDMRLKEH